MSPAPEIGPVEQVLSTAPATLRPIVEGLMTVVRELHPDAQTTAWPKQRIISYGFGPKKMTEHYFYIGVQPKHVNAGFYYGATLPDPDSLLEGTGKSLRHVKLRSLGDARRPGLLALLGAAKAERAGQ